MTGAQNILVIKLGALGDFIQALGPMKAIRAYHPDAKISLLTTKPFTDLARQSGYFDDIIIDTRPKWFDVAGWVGLRKVFNDGKYTRVYDLQNNDRTSIYFNLFSKKPEWVGVAKGASHRNASPARTAGKAFEGHKQTLALASITRIEIDDLSWIVPEHDFDLPHPYVLIIPGGSEKHPEKRWPTPSYIFVCRSLIEKSITPVLIGTKAEGGVTSAIKDAVPKAIDLTGKTSLFDLPALARGANAAIGNDTGPMHMIGPTGCSSLVLFSQKSDPVRHAPLGAHVATLQKERLENLKPEAVWNEFCRYAAGL